MLNDQRIELPEISSNRLIVPFATMFQIVIRNYISFTAVKNRRITISSFVLSQTIIPYSSEISTLSLLGLLVSQYQFNKVIQT